MNKYLVHKIIRYNTKLVYHETVEYLINTVAETPVDLYKNCVLSTTYRHEPLQPLLASISG